ncbi:MFS transporter [Clostridiales bacterium COT073_COT-073]|nr:MFS transporter [Clostridiales bacterium COT073_COT-073]
MKTKFTKKELSWITYDWANSAYSLAVTSTILPIFYTTVAAKNLPAAQTQAYWGYSNTIATIIVALLAPILGTIADYKGFKKKFFTIFLAIGLLSTAALSLVQENNYILCLTIYVFSVLGFSGSNLFYDSFLTDATTEDKYDKVSTYGFAFGYIGSCIPFLICIGIIMKAEALGLTTMLATQLSFILTAVWWLVFSFPILKNVDQQYYVEPEKHPIRSSLSRLFNTLKKIHLYRNVVLFLVAYFFYIDGVHTIISMATVYASVIGIDKNTLMIALLAVQVVAFPSAIIFGHVVNKVSAKTLLFIAISVYIIITYIGYLMSTPFHFWLLAILVGTQQGGIQAISRSSFGKLIPKENSAEFFGFFSIFGKFSAALGPMIVGGVGQLTNNTRIGVLSLIPLFILGLFFLSKVDFNSRPKAINE